MERDEIVSRLRGIAASSDHWFRVWETEEGGFQVADPSGIVAAIVVDQHWVEVCTARPLDAAGRALIGSGTASSLLRVVAGADPPAFTVRGRVYADGFSLQALFLAVRDVLALAGPPPPALALEPRTVEAPAPPAMTDLPAASDSPAPEDVTVAEGEPTVDGTTAAEPPAPTPIAVQLPEALTPATGTVAPVTAERGADTSEPDVTEETVAPSLEKPSDAARVSDTPPAGTPLVSRVDATVRISRDALAELAPSAPPAPGEAPGVCRRCGADVQSGERFCITCGAPQSSGAATVPPVPPPPEKGRLADTVVWRRPAPGSTGEPEQTTAAPDQAKDCPRCGHANPTTNRFCQGCGSALTP